MTSWQILRLFLPVENVETAVIGAAEDLRVVVAEGDAEDAELEAWRSQGQLQVRLVLVRGGRGGETDLVEVVTPRGVHQPVSGMTHCHVQHRPANIPGLQNRTSQLVIIKARGKGFKKIFSV